MRRACLSSLLLCLLSSLPGACASESPNRDSAIGGSSGAGAAGSAAGGAASGGTSSAGAGPDSAGSSAGAAGSVGGAGAAGSSGAPAGAGASGAPASAGSSASGGSGGAPPIDKNAAAVIVVLGSSTAAGIGPSKPGFAWVERYRAYLKKEFPNFELINLAFGGYTTYEIQPSDYEPPANRPEPITNRNITAALSRDADAIVINLPSNDLADRIPLADTMANFGRVTDLAAANGVPCWVATSQPRNFSDSAQRAGLFATRDAIEAEYAERALDFWTSFAASDGKIESKYDSGDGVHMNDAAHALLAERVIAANIPLAILTKL